MYIVDAIASRWMQLRATGEAKAQVGVACWLSDSAVLFWFPH